MSEELYNVLIFKDANGKAKSVLIENEEYMILNNKILLNYIPDRNNKVIINGMYEVKQGQNITSNTQFKVNYTNGEVTFHSDKNNTTIVVTKYFGIGIIRIYADRVIDSKGNPIDTSISLQDYIDSVKPYGYKGNYSPTATYEPSSIVAYDYGIYRCKQTAKGFSPTNTTYWELMVSMKNEVDYAKAQGDYAKASADGILLTSEDFTPETITVNNDIAPLVKSELNRIDSQLAEKANIDPYKNDLNNSLKVYGTFPTRNYPIANNYAGLQGSTVVGNKLYATLSRTVENGTALLLELDYNTLAILRSAELSLYHANDIAYNPNYNGKEVLIIPHTSTDAVTPSKVSVVDIATLTILEDKILPSYVYSLSYDQTNHKYVGFGSVGSNTKLYVFNDSFALLNTYDIESSGNTPQGSEIYGDAYIQVSTKQNALYLYNNVGKLIKKFAVSDGYGELESCAYLGNDSFLLGFNASKTSDSSIQFYKVTLKETVKIENGIAINGQVPYATKEQSVDIYMDCNYIGSDSDGSQAKPFKTFADMFSALSTNNCYTDLFIAPGTYPEKPLFQYFSGVTIYLQNSNPGGGEVKLNALSLKSFLGEFVTKDITIYGTTNKLLSTTNNAIELVDVYKFRRINTKITNEGNVTNSRGLRTSNSNVVDEGAIESKNCTEAIQLGDTSNYYTNPTATFTFSGNTTVLDVRSSKATISSAFATAMGTSYLKSNGGIIEQWDTIADGYLPSSAGDVVTVINDYVTKGYKSGRILFAQSGSTIPTNMPTAYTTTAFIKFEVYQGSSMIYLEAINFSVTATKFYKGQISGTTIVWKSATLA